MPVVFANEPNPDLVRKALERFAVDVAARQRVEREKVENDDHEPIRDEKRAQNRI